MESFKETLSSWFENFNEYINSFKVVEKQKNIFYFSKYSLILSDFYQIYVFVKTLKENIFRSLIEQFKYCVKSIIKFENESLTEKEKIINLYSSLLFIYYKKFGYDTNNKFEDYFDNQFIEISKNVFKYEIVNNELFKIFVFYYYTFIQKEINSLGYERIKKLKTYYNYKYNINLNENINKTNNNDQKYRKISNTNTFSNRNNTSTTISNTSNNDYFPDPNILLAKKKPIKKNININNSKNNKIINNNKINNPNTINTINYNNINTNIINNNNSNTNSMTIEDSDDDIEMENATSNQNNQQNQSFDYWSTEQVLTYLTSTKERMVDLVVEMGFKGLSPLFLMDEYNIVNESFKKFNNISLEDYQNKGISFEINNEKNNDDMDDLPQKTKTLNVNKNSINSINKNNNIINFINPLNSNNNNDNSNNTNNNIINNNNKINNKNNNNNKNNITSDKSQDINLNNSFFSINNFVPSCGWPSFFTNFNNNEEKNIKNNQNQNSNDGSSNNIFSKRILSELSKFEVDDQIIKIIEIVAKKIDEHYLDDMLNNSPKKTVTVINSFSCYIVEFPPEMLQNIDPQHKKILENYCIKFIVIAKELYNISMELFTTIYDLSYTNLDTFIDLSKNCGIKIEYAQSLYKMFKDYSTMLLKEKESFANIKMILGKLFKQQKKLWNHTIKQKANEFTSFYKV